MCIPKQVVTLCVVGSLLAVVASCIDSKNPLSDEKTSKIDERLIGAWKLSGDNDLWKVSKSKGVKNALEVTVPESKVPDRVFTTTIKSKSYLSVQDEDPKTSAKREAAPYQIYQYRFIDKDSVEFRPMNSGVVEKAIAAKQLRGEMVRDTPVITDTPEAIAKYIEAHADACFLKAADNEAVIFKRQK
jgi:hypothetical protein